VTKPVIQNVIKPVEKPVTERKEEIVEVKDGKVDMMTQTEEYFFKL